MASGNTPSTEAGWRAMAREAARPGRQAVAAFVDALASGDRAALHAALVAMSRHGGWRSALRRVTRMQQVHPEIRECCLSNWIEDGDAWRGEGRDLELLNALRVMLPPYQGGPLLLYRGDSARNRQRRTYGMSWTTDCPTAESFACGYWRTFQGGSVLLRAHAPAAAIICAAGGAESDRYKECEYLVDRRQLAKVEVIVRYGQISPEAYAEECAARNLGRS